MISSCRRFKAATNWRWWRWIRSSTFTKPPARFTEAALVKELEKRGIGRPSTYAAIISIQDRGYVEGRKSPLLCREDGEIVTERLVESFRELMSYDFTAQMENSLDVIAEGELD